MAETDAPEVTVDDKADRKAEGDAETVLSVMLRHPGIGSMAIRERCKLGPTSIARALDLLERTERAENRVERRGKREYPHWYPVAPTTEEGGSS